MKRILLGCAAAACLAIPAQADWFPGEPHKMHYPQLPDPNGWDINVHDFTIADDWECSQTGLVSDVHLWLSWEQDFGDPLLINTITLSIHDDIPAGIQAPWSLPGPQLWGGTYTQGQFTFLGPENGNQGFISNPDLLPGGGFQPNDHVNYWQINIDDLSNGLADPLFTQQQGNIYWLDVNIQTDAGGVVGWKTSLDHFNDAAVYRFGNDPWLPMTDPNTLQNIDMAFVITPEPAPAMLGLLGITLLMFRRRDR